MDQNGRSLAKSAFRFVLIIGIANFFADLTYESARSINGQYLAALGAASAAVGFTAGFGELVGYGLRSLFGLITDRTGKYWLFTILGYIINLLAVPAMALADNWPVAAVLIVAERTGRAIRKPPTEAMLSYAGKQIGRGRVFGLNEALDQAGATLGPLAMALGSIRTADLFRVWHFPSLSHPSWDQRETDLLEPNSFTNHSARIDHFAVGHLDDRDSVKGGLVAGGDRPRNGARVSPGVAYPLLVGCFHSICRVVPNAVSGGIKRGWRKPEAGSGCMYRRATRQLGFRG